MNESLKKITREKSKVALVALLSFISVFVLTVIFDTQHSGNVQSVQATSTATTTVTVLNTPPNWTLTAREAFASATNTPTNVGTSTMWEAIVTDNNGEPYILLICKSSSTPAFPWLGSNVPTPQCGGGASDQWAQSATTSSGARATVATTTYSSTNEVNDWYGYACDLNVGSPRCNAAMYNGLHESGAATATSSPFVVNHAPSITFASDDSPTLPGNIVTWTTIATDTIDVIRGPDQLRLFVCQTNGFDATIPNCTGGGWASSTLQAGANPSTSTTLAIPLQDRDHDAYIYVVDEFGLEATGAWQGSSTLLTVQNAMPYVSSSTIQVYDVYGTTTTDQDLNLTVEEGETDNFVVEFQVVDDNSCEEFGGGDEIDSVNINVFRYNDTDPYTQSLLCDAFNEYNANYCYTDTSTSFVPTCYQRPGSCTGPDDGDAVWECTFSMWYIADPTDTNSQYEGHDWRASARASDEALTSPYSTYNQGVDIAGSANMIQFLSFRATGTPIAYGSLEPGQENPTHTASTTVYATGNTGLDHYLSGDAMCSTYPTCTGYATSTIFVPYQHYSLSLGALYAAGTPLSTTTAPVLVDVAITKPQATTSAPNDTTFWAIHVPATITFAGDYLGRNYIDAAVAPSGDW